MSALATPEATYAGHYLHTDLFEMAAAYLFHIVRNHPFVDGNKRTGLIAALVFLGLNDLVLDAEPDPLFELVVRVAGGSATKAEAAVFFERRSRSR
jgi:death-on-curing protein